MGIGPGSVFTHHSSADNTELVFRIENPVLAKVMKERRKLLQGPRDQNSNLLEKFALYRILVIEGIPGSGKDAFQAYLKEKLDGRDVYDFSEGELLHSWKHVPIAGILKLRLKFIKLFVNYVKDVVSQDENAVFLLNRFHLSTYVSTIVKQPQLEREYDEIINVLRTLQVHVFILRLDDNEIEKRSSHIERSSPWRKYQQQSVTKDGFKNTLERYLWQQNLIIETAKRQKIPYSVIKMSSAPKIDNGSILVPKVPGSIRRVAQLNAAPVKISRRKGDLPRTL